MKATSALAIAAFLAVVFSALDAGAMTRLVKADGTGDVVTIQDGVDASAAGDTVTLAPGTYTGVGNRDVNFKGRAITVTSQGGAAVTIVDCQGLGRGFIFTGGETATSVLSRLTIRNGAAVEGAGIYAHVALPTLTDNIIENNTAVDAGGGIFAYGAVGTPAVWSGNTITGNVVTGGLASLRGGGIWSASNALTIEDNTIANNMAGIGGGLWLDSNGTTFLNDNRITDNTATTQGGGVYVQAGIGAAGFNRNWIAGNEAGNWGGGIYTNGADVVIEDCVVVDNNCGLLGSGIYFNGDSPTLRNGTVAYNNGNGAIIVYSSSARIEKSIVAFNSSNAMSCFSGGAPTVSCSDLFGNGTNTICGTDDGTNFSSDPLFCDPLSGDYSIAPTSPAAPFSSPCGVLVGALPQCNPSSVDIPTYPDAVLEVFPNPFNPTTTIRYRLDAGGNVSLAVYDVHGGLVRTLVDEYQSPATRTVTWNGVTDDGGAAASGVYFCRLTGPRIDESRKMLLVK